MLLFSGLCQVSPIILRGPAQSHGGVMVADPDCVFCKIVAGTVPCFKLYEDGETLAFMDINPVHDGHCLVIPKAHFPTVFDIAPDAVAAVARTTAAVAKAVNAALRPDGLNLVQSNARGAAQHVDHFHMHVLPRLLGDGLLLNWMPIPGDMARIAELAGYIRARL
jgi:histidine triad (HIT) family protein